MASLIAISSSKFHSVYINSLFLALIKPPIYYSKFHSVYINSASKICTTLKKSTQNSILFILIGQAPFYTKIWFLSQNSILFILIAVIESNNLTQYDSKFHSVYINSFNAAVIYPFNCAQNSILFILIANQTMHAGLLVHPQNSILFILIGLAVVINGCEKCLKIPFCLY